MRRPVPYPEDEVHARTKSWPHEGAALVTRGRSPGLKGNPALRGIKVNKHESTSFQQGLSPPSLRLRRGRPESRLSGADYGGFRLVPP
jgi:hypothetical protein